jgi:hypothetical protein
MSAASPTDKSSGAPTPPPMANFPLLQPNAPFAPTTARARFFHGRRAHEVYQKRSARDARPPRCRSVVRAAMRILRTHWVGPTLSLGPWAGSCCTHAVLRRASPGFGDDSGATRHVCRVPSPNRYDRIRNTSCARSFFGNSRHGRCGSATSARLSWCLMRVTRATQRADGSRMLSDPRVGRKKEQIDRARRLPAAATRASRCGGESDGRLGKRHRGL